MLGEGKRGLIEMLDRMHVCYIPEEEVMRFDPEGKSFVNINTMEDYDRIASSGQLHHQLLVNTVSHTEVL
jgi:molybdopterin-guanine dinucleotide biosynthesis protein A